MSINKRNVKWHNSLQTVRLDLCMHYSAATVQMGAVPMGKSPSNYPPLSLARPSPWSLHLLYSLWPVPGTLPPTTLLQNPLPILMAEAACDVSIVGQVSARIADPKVVLSTS